MSLKWLDRLEERIIMCLIAGGTLIIVASVVHRYLSGLPLGALQKFLVDLHFGWAQELCIFMFVWMAKFGAAYGVRTGIHVGVDVLLNRLSPAKRKPVILFGLLAGALFTLTIALIGSEFVLEQFNYGNVTADLRWPTWVVYLALPIGSFLMCFRFIQVALAFHKTGELPHHDHAHVDDLEGVELEVKS
ncbi:MAG: TRAP transporter small permease [Formosimonas sp.]